MASTWNKSQTWSMKESLCMNQVIRNVHQSMRKVEIDGIKVDYYDAKNKVIHEIKKSNKVDKAHELSNTLPDAKAVEEIMGIEGNIRQTYYAAFDIIIDDFNMGPWKSVMMRLSVIVL